MSKTNKESVRIPRSEYARLVRGKSLERVAEILRLSPRYARSIELHGTDCDHTAGRLAHVTGADEMDYTVPRLIAISRIEYRRLTRAAEPARRAYKPRRRLAGRRRNPSFLEAKP